MVFTEGMPKSIGDILTNKAKEVPNQAAVCIGDNILTYQELDEMSNKIAHALYSVAFENEADDTLKEMNPNDIIISVIAQNSFEYCQIFWGALKARMPMVPLNPLYGRKEMHALLLQSKSNFLFVDKSMVDIIENIVKNESDLSDLKYIIYLPSSSSTTSKPNFSNTIRIKSYHNFCNLGKIDYFDHSALEKVPVSLNNVEEKERYTAYCACTSGTTSLPKIACYGIQSILKMSSALGPALCSAGSDYFLMANFAGSTTPGIFLQGIKAGACLHLLDKNKPNISPFEQVYQKWMSVEKWDFQTVILFGDQFRWLIDAAKANPEDFKKKTFSPRSIMYMGMKFPRVMVEELMAIFPSSLIIQLYGSTELGGVSMLLDGEHRSFSQPFMEGSCGKLILPKDNLRIVDINTREIITEPNQKGEIQVKIVRGAFKYLNNNALTEKEFHSNDGFFSPGDIGKLDENGYLYIVDRLKDMIILPNARNVYTNEIEDCLSSFDNVIKEALVFGIPHEGGIGEIPCAAIILAKDISDSIKQDVKNKILKYEDNFEEMTQQSELLISSIFDHCRKNLSSYKVPQKLIIVDNFPRSNNFKILKSEMIKIALSLKE